MESKELKPFQELNHTNQVLRLEMFGGIKTNIAEYDNPLIECVFTPLANPYPTSSNTKPYPQREEQFIAGIAVGYLPSLFLGQCFQNGRQLPRRKWPLPAEQIVMKLNVSDPTSVIECSLSDIRAEKSFIHDSFNEIEKQAGIKKLRGHLLQSSNQKTNQKIKLSGIPLPVEVFIHEMELIRFYLTNSSHSCKNIFNGSFADETINKKVVNEIHEKKYLDPNTGHGRFVYRHGYKGVDASILGRILLDPTGLALKAAQRVHTTITADKINSDDHRLGYPQTLFPFEGETTLKLSGRYIKTTATTEYIFFVYRIDSCSGPFPYKSLSYCDEFQPGGNPAPIDAPVSIIKRTKNAEGEDEGDDDRDIDPLIGESKSDEPPSSNSIELRVELGNREFVGLAGVRIIREKVRDCSYRTETKVVPRETGLPNGSTGARTSGESSARKQSVTEQTIIASAFTADLSAFINSMKAIAIAYKSWQISPVIVGSGPEDGQMTSYFPEVKCEKKMMMRQFSFVDDGKLLRRRFICYQVVVNDRYLYLFDAQRRPREPQPPKGKSQYKEMLPILLLHSSGYEEHLGDDFLEVLEETVKRKSWPNEDKLQLFCRDSQSQDQDAIDIAALQKNIVVLIERNCK